MRKSIHMIKVFGTAIVLFVLFVSTCPRSANASSTSFDYNTFMKYVDPKTYASFFVPFNWVQTDYTDYIEDESSLFNYVHFSSSENAYQGFTYLSMDVWEALSQEERTNLEKAGITRSNLSIFVTVEQVASSFNIPVNEISRNVFGTHEFYMFTALEQGEWLGQTSETISRYAVCYENGYAHAFILDLLYPAFSYDSFMDILESFEIPTSFTDTSSRIEFVSESKALSMLLPQGWVIQKTDDLSDYGLFSTLPNMQDPIIMLVTNDLWDMLNETTRSWYQSGGYDRTALDSLFEGRELVASSLGKTGEDLSLWEDGNKSFYLYWDVMEATVQGQVEFVDTLCAYTIQDGYSFVFALCDMSYSSENRECFLELLRSVRIP